MRKIFFTGLLIILSNFLYSQGTIRGKVIDKSTGDDLIGANVFLVGTTYGAMADFDGNFTISGIPEGSYTLRCSFISYETQDVKNVTIKKGDVTVINFTLGEASFELQAVVVVRKQVTHTETAIDRAKIKSPTLLDGISSQQISRSGDSDAAGALKRVTGISVEGGKYIYVRGLGDRYSKTLLNGAEIPGLDPNKNSVQMDLFPSNLIDNMMVYKSFSPELPGSFTGGLVDIITKDFPEKYTFQFSTSFGYNTNASLNKDFLSYKGGSLDWLGIDDGSRKIPDAAEGKIPYLYFDNTTLDEITRSFNKQMDPEKIPSFLNHSHSISVGNQDSLFGKPFGYVFGLTYQRDFQFYDDGLTGRFKLTDHVDEVEFLNTELNLNDTKGTQEVLMGAIANLHFKISENSKIGFNFIRNQGGQTTARFQEGRKPSDDPDMVYQTRTIQYLQRAFTSGQIKGKHLLKNLGNTEINWISSVTVSQQDEPDLRFFSTDYNINSEGDTLFHIRPSVYGVPVRYFREMWERNSDNKVNFEKPFTFLGDKSKLKFGASYVEKYRIFTERRIDYKDQNGSYNGIIDDYLSDENIGPGSSGTYGLYVEDATDIKNSYEASQNVVGAYLMADMPLGLKLRATYGLRLESTGMLVESYDTEKEPGELNEADLLPAVNLTYFLKEDTTNLRFAYARTLARPTFRELAPYSSFDFLGDFTIIGNPELERTIIDNLDIRWETFRKRGEIISFSGFFKRFNNPIERTFNPMAANPELTYRNVKTAIVGGVEAEFRKSLDFIGILRNIKLGVNITLVKSKVSIDSLELVAIHATNPYHKNTRLMFGQPPYIINISANYQHDSTGISSTISYNVTGEKLSVVVVGGTPSIYEQPRHQLDFNISKKFGKNISMKLSVANLLNDTYLKTYTYKEKQYVFESYSMGRTFSIGFSYLID
ncbi:MAG: hypothetical protein A2W91_06910 [Bacteroidetes bacterium GWF2_38_335]|nr:MAG: hypothetical protein A2W91_06910 [Bacteroidetes bacterium GWF2_38_335]OFY80895.1 MAG: hypothetical protein A2281_04795 [Bacteroidetes bacterium RIFOXYA12_FULL_38_20]HBS84947.1 TonB-dependent receptor [Bacteroidales bacterium]